MSGFLVVGFLLFWYVVLLGLIKLLEHVFGDGGFDD